MNNTSFIIWLVPCARATHLSSGADWSVTSWLQGQTKACKEKEFISPFVTYDLRYCQTADMWDRHQLHTQWQSINYVHSGKVLPYKCPTSLRQTLSSSENQNGGEKNPRQMSKLETLSPCVHFCRWTEKNGVQTTSRPYTSSGRGLSNKIITYSTEFSMVVNTDP